ncbi:protein O-mannosyl-transferase family [Haliangium sp.]|uniref:protein O-mannosyl-transferase family n=1 Tax=Haliangium sp. TaxID=2663208 RepID=UPI003D0EDE04
MNTDTGSGERAGPRFPRGAQLVILAALSWLAFELRRMLAIDGVLDTDVMNFGLAGIRFDVLAHQPHPPGYPGYVLLISLLHALAPGLDPISLAVWATRVTGVALIPATWWACRQVLASAGAEPDSDSRPLVAAALAVFHPLLWYYGGDGQSHSAEALLVVLLFGAGVAVRRRAAAAPAGRMSVLLLVAAFGLAGSVRPTISLLSSPVLVWVFWGRPWRDWLLAAAVGVAAVAAWYAPLIAYSGGWDLYTRASRALVGELFVANFSVLGERSTLSSVLFNLSLTGVSAALALVPLLALARPRGQAWLRPATAVMAVNVGFYALVFLSESGYLTAVAALACLVPATWPKSAPAQVKLRAAAVVAASLGFVALAPGGLPMWGTPVFLPSYAHVREVEDIQRLYRDVVCSANAGEPALVVSNNPTTINLRWIPLTCPDLTSGLYLGDNPLRRVDAWMVFTHDHMVAVPGPVPHEPGPPAEYTTPPAARIIAAPDSSEAFIEALERAQRCPPERHASPLVGDILTVTVWSRACLPRLGIGANVIDIPPP